MSKPKASAPEGLITAADAAVALGVSVGRIRQFVAEKRLIPAKTISGSHMFRQEDVLKLSDRKPGRPAVAAPAKQGGGA